MSYSACDLHSSLDQLLSDAGFWITGDDDDTGWGYAFGINDQGPDLARGIDTAAEASAAALSDFVGRVSELVSAARKVSECWEQGDLAEAVRELEASRRQLEPQSSPHATDLDRSSWLHDRLRDLKTQGLSIGDCLQVLGVRTDSDPLARKAFLEHHVEGEVEFDQFTVVSQSDRGAHVLAWVWTDSQ